MAPHGHAPAADSKPAQLCAAVYEDGLNYLQARRPNTLANAFAADPLWQWMVDSDGEVPHADALAIARMSVAATGPADEMHGFRNHDAIAIWLAPPDRVNEADELWQEDIAAPHLEALLASRVGSRMDRLLAIFAVLGEARPDEPHWYLANVAVSPARQGRGLGTKVMAPMLARSDRLGIPTYLEWANPRNHSFYRRLGYEEVGEKSAADSPPLIGFLRRPR